MNFFTKLKNVGNEGKISNLPAYKAFKASKEELGKDLDKIQKGIAACTIKLNFHIYHCSIRDGNKLYFSYKDILKGYPNAIKRISELSKKVNFSKPARNLQISPYLQVVQILNDGIYRDEEDLEDANYLEGIENYLEDKNSHKEPLEEIKIIKTTSSQNLSRNDSQIHSSDMRKTQSSSGRLEGNFPAYKAILSLGKKKTVEEKIKVDNEEIYKRYKTIANKINFSKRLLNFYIRILFNKSLEDFYSENEKYFFNEPITAEFALFAIYHNDHLNEIEGQNCLVEFCLLDEFKEFLLLHYQILCDLKNIKYKVYPPIYTKHMLDREIKELNLDIKIKELNNKKIEFVKKLQEKKISI